LKATLSDKFRGLFAVNQPARSILISDFPAVATSSASERGGRLRIPTLVTMAHVTGLRKAESCSVLYKGSVRGNVKPMKTTRHTINLPAEIEQLLNERIRDFRSLSAYFVSLCFTDLLYLPKRPIAKAFANASWQQQRRATESLVTLQKQGWKGISLKLHVDAATQVEKVAQKCLKPDDWLLDHIQEELAFMRGEDLRR
jgi:hypothetical protein